MNDATPLVDAAAPPPAALCPNCAVGRLGPWPASCPVCGCTEQPAPAVAAGRSGLSAGLIIGYALWGLSVVALAVATLARFGSR
jgi:hypothetical protein